LLHHAMGDGCTMSDDKRVTIRVRGRVQGVGFRYFAREAANALKLTGFVRNTSDGDVEVVAEGNEGLLARFVGLLRQGPPSAVVTDMDVSWQDWTGAFDRFYVRG
jgi:acylphosphatase